MDEPQRSAERGSEALGIRAGQHPRHAPGAEPTRSAGAARAPVPPSADAATPPSAPAPGPPSVTIAPPDPLVPAPGTLIAGRYRLTARLAAGATDVWRADDELLGRAVALKLATSTGAAGTPDRLLAEARALAAVRHPGVVGLHDVLSGRWGMALVLELLPGDTLAARLRRDGAVSAPIAISVGMQLAAALDGIHHAGLVHRDVKPANVIVRPDGHVRLIDFGIARQAGQGHGLTPEGQVEGTLRSIAPEQLAGGAVTPATDLFGLGTVLYELLEGRPPYDTADPMRLARLHRAGRPAMILAPAPLADLVGRLLEPNPAARPASAAAVLDQLRVISGVLSGTAGPRGGEAGGRAPTRHGRAPSRGRRFRVRAALLGGCLVVTAAATLALGVIVPSRPAPGPSGDGSPAQAGASPGTDPLPSRPPVGAGVAAAIQSPGATAQPSSAATPRPTVRSAPTPRPTRPSTFAVLDPIDGATTDGTAILVRGQAPPGSTVTRDVPLWFDEHITADADGHWSIVIRLSAGENKLVFRLGDDRSTQSIIRVTSEPGRAGDVIGG